MKTQTEMMEQLLQNDNFVKIFIEKYLGSDISDIVLTNDIKNQEVQNLLIARTVFKEYIEQLLDYDIIQSIKS